MHSGRYLPQNWIGLFIMTAGVASLTALDAGSSLAMALGLQVLVGPGLGMICASARCAGSC